MPQAPTILLIEDDEADAARVCQVLAEVGATIWHAESGADARTVLRESQPDLILIDLTLPDLRRGSSPCWRATLDDARLRPPRRRTVAQRMARPILDACAWTSPAGASLSMTSR